MKTTMSFWNMRVRWLMIFIMLNACVDRIHFSVPEPQLQIVIEGMISDSPGPYIVKVSKGLSLDADSSFHVPVQRAKIKLYDDEGNAEDFAETVPGEYKSGGIIQGKIGHSYYIRLETSEGNIFESEPDMIYPVGEVDNIRYEYEARTAQENYGGVQADVFNIYIDSHAGNGDQNYVRWRFKGTYKVVTNPELRMTWLQGEHYFKNPFPCSGYIVAPSIPGGTLEQRDPCTCCTCWVNEFETVPQLSDVQLVSGNQFKNIRIAEVPINNATFFEKYLVEVEQMSLSKTSFEFFRQVRSQKEGASSIFQPPSGEIRGNIKTLNSSLSVVGIFWAASISKKFLFIDRSKIPYKLTPLFFPKPCTYFPNSSTTKPSFWE